MVQENRGSSGDSIGRDVTVAAADATSGGRQRLRWRRRLVLALVVVSSLGVLTSAVAFWTHRTLMDTDAWVDTVGPVADDPAVQQALATYLTKQLTEAIEPERILDNTLPERAQSLSAPLSTAVEQFIYDVTLKVIQSDQFQQLWAAVNRYGHEAVVDFLRGDSRLVQANGGVVTVDVLPVMAKVLRAVQDKAPRLVPGKTVPEVTYEMPVDDQRKALQSVIRRPLPPDFGVFTIVKSDQLAAVQAGVVIFDRVVWVLAIVTIGLMVGAVLLSVDRLRTLVQLGAGVAIAMVFAIGVISAVKNLVLDLVADPVNRSAAATTMRALLRSFTDVADTLLVVGVLLVAGAFLAGDSRWAKQLRGLVSGAWTPVVPESSAVAEADQGPFPWIAQRRIALMVAGALAAGAWLLLADVSLGLLMLISLLLALYEAGVSVLSRPQPFGSREIRG